MNEIQMIPESEAAVTFARGRMGERISKALEAFKGMRPGFILQVVGSNDDSLASWKQAFQAAGEALGITPRFKVSGDKLGVWVDALPARQAPAATDGETVLADPLRQVPPEVVAEMAEAAETPKAPAAYQGDDWRDIAQGKEKPFVKVLLPKIKHGRGVFCNPAIAEPHLHEQHQDAWYCVWEGPEDRMPNMKGQVVVNG